LVVLGLHEVAELFDCGVEEFAHEQQPRGAISSIHTVRWMPAHPSGGDAGAMDQSTRPQLCAIRIRGHLGETLLAAFPELDAKQCDGETVLIGTLPDQAALFGALAQIEALGLELLEVRRDSVADEARDVHE
jgi:hypothetical protein